MTGLSFSQELLDEIFSNVGDNDHATMYSLALTSRNFRSSVEPLLYKRITLPAQEFDGPRDTVTRRDLEHKGYLSIIALFRTLYSNLKKAKLVRSLYLRHDIEEYDGPLFCRAILHLRKLRSLTIDHGCRHIAEFFIGFYPISFELHHLSWSPSQQNYCPGFLSKQPELRYLEWNSDLPIYVHKMGIYFTDLRCVKLEIDVPVLNFLRICGEQLVGLILWEGQKDMSSTEHEWGKPPIRQTLGRLELFGFADEHPDVLIWIAPYLQNVRRLDLFVASDSVRRILLHCYLITL
jgi:hypothetical protein